ncbi:MAG: glycosyltransferase family 2 protein, partial [Pseudobdellovibrio sp.]
MPKASIIIPIYNEVKSLRKIVEQILSIDHGFSYEIILVDSGSNDGSSDVVNELVK